jgi:cytochrome P450
MAVFTETIVECAADMVRDWEGKTSSGEAIDLRKELVIATLRVTLRNLFHVEPDLAKLAPAVAEVSEQVHFGKQFVPFHLPKWVQTPAQRRFARGMEAIDAFVYGVIAQRKAETAPGDDLVSLLQRARDEETGEGMSDLQLRDELVTMLVAGHDTVTDAIVWTLILLAQHPEFQQPLREELRRVAGSQWPTLESLKELDLLGRVIHESLRLYPSAWVFARTALSEDEIGGYRIPAGSIVAISPYVMHRSRRFWEDPLRFDPDRFLPERSADRPRFAYFPFGGGQRQCIGAGLAMVEVPLILAGILQHFDFEVPDAQSILPSPRISLRPKGIVRLKLRALSKGKQSETIG